MNIQIGLSRILEILIMLGVVVACIAFAGGALDFFKLRVASLVSLVATGCAIIATLTYFVVSDRDLKRPS